MKHASVVVFYIVNIILVHHNIFNNRCARPQLINAINSQHCFYARRFLKEATGALHLHRSDDQSADSLMSDASLKPPVLCLCAGPVQSPPLGRRVDVRVESRVCAAGPFYHSRWADEDISAWAADCMNSQRPEARMRDARVPPGFQYLLTEQRRVASTDCACGTAQRLKSEVYCNARVLSFGRACSLA